MPEPTLRGSCLCNGVKFAIEGEPENVFICYCTHCSKNAGGPGQISAKYLANQIKISSGNDLIHTFVLNDNLSGFPKNKMFCRECGCTLWTVPMKHGGTHYIVRTALLEDGLQKLKPKAEFFSSKKVELPSSIKKFETMPGH